MSSPTPQILDQYTNATLTTLAGGAGGVGSPLNSGDTTMYLPTGVGALYPSTANGTFTIRLGINLPGQYEIIKCSVRSGDTLTTIVRAQEGTTARTWFVGTFVENVLSAGTVLNIQAASTQVYNVKAFGAIGNNSFDCTTAIQAAINAANANGGGTVFFPQGTYITQTLQIFSRVHLVGEGPELSQLSLKNGTNADLIWAGSTNQAMINAAASISSGADAPACTYWGIHNLKLYGNAANQSGTSYVLEIYGYGWILENLDITLGLTGNIRCDWHGVYADIGPTVLCYANNVDCHDSYGFGWQHYGPTDCKFANCGSGNNATHNYYQGPNGIATQLINWHTWAPGISLGPSNDPNAVGMLLESQAMLSNCESEGGNTACVVVLGNGTIVRGGSYFGTGGNNTSFQIGQAAGNTPYQGQTLVSGGLTTAVAVMYVDIDTSVHDTNLSAHGCYWIALSGGFNRIRGICRAQLTTGSGGLYGGSLSTSDMLDVSTNNLGAANTNISITQLAGLLVLRPSSGVAVPGTGGTINTAPFAMSRVAPTGNITGVILQAGISTGQIVIVENQSAFTITFAASGTSHVADGTSDVIAANTSRMFVYDTGTSLWSRLG